MRGKNRRVFLYFWSLFLQEKLTNDLTEYEFTFTPNRPKNHVYNRFKLCSISETPHQCTPFTQNIQLSKENFAQTPRQLPSIPEGEFPSYWTAYLHKHRTYPWHLEHRSRITATEGHVSSLLGFFFKKKVRDHVTRTERLVARASTEYIAVRREEKRGGKGDPWRWKFEVLGQWCAWRGWS